MSAGAVLLSSLKSGSAREFDSFRRLKGGAMAPSIRQPLHLRLGSSRPARRFGKIRLVGSDALEMAQASWFPPYDAASADLVLEVAA